MANETVQSGLTGLSSLVVAEARSEFANLSALDAYIRKQSVPKGAVSAKFPSFGALTATALTDGNAYANQALASTGVTLTPTVAAGASTIITDLANQASATQLAIDFGKEAATAIVKKKNADIWALFDGFSVAVGTAKAAITEAVIISARNKVRNTGVAGDVFLAVTPNVMGEILKIYAAKSGFYPAAIQDAIYRGEAPILFGVRLVEVNGIADDYGVDVKCGLFSSYALGFAEAWDIKVDAINKPSSVGIEVTASAAYAVGELQDNLGVEILCANGPTYT